MLATPARNNALVLTRASHVNIRLGLSILAADWSDWSDVLVSYLAAEISSVTLRASLHILRVFLALLPLHKRAHAVRSAAGNGWSPWLAQLWQ